MNGSSSSSSVGERKAFIQQKWERTEDLEEKKGHLSPRGVAKFPDWQKKPESWPGPFCKLLAFLVGTRNKANQAERKPGSPVHLSLSLAQVAGSTARTVLLLLEACELIT